MRTDPRRLFLLGGLAFVVGILQNANISLWPGVKPNFILAFLLQLSFYFSSWMEYAFVVALGLLGVRFVTFLDPALLAVAVLTQGVFFLKRRFPGKPLLNAAAVTFCATPAFYLFVAPSLLKDEFFTLMAEASYNMIAGIGVFIAVRGIVRHEAET